MEDLPQSQSPEKPVDTMLPSPHIDVYEGVDSRSEGVRQANNEAISSTLGYMASGGDPEDLADGQVYKKFSQSARETVSDPLTGLLNRKGMELWMARRMPEAFGVIFADGQSFGHINKDHGHDVGDEVIQYIGSEIMKKFRTGDTEEEGPDDRRSDHTSKDAIGVTRWGGDEFFIVLDLSSVPEDQREKVLEMAQDRLKNFGEYKYTNPSGNEVSVPISIDSVGALGEREENSGNEYRAKSLDQFRRELDPLLTEKKRQRKASQVV